MNIMALQSLLLNHKLKIDKAFSGTIALDIIRDRIDSGEPMYDLILMDYSMPELDGPSTTAMVRDIIRKQNTPLIPQPYICCVSAYSETFFRNNAINSGMNDFKTKPVPKQEIDELLAELGINAN